MPAPFTLVTKQVNKKGKKQFAAFKMEVEKKAQQNDNFFIDKIDDAVNAEEYNKMQALLQPIALDRALSKIDQYSSNAPKNKKGSGLSALDPFP